MSAIDTWTNVLCRKPPKLQDQVLTDLNQERAKEKAKAKAKARVKAKAKERVRDRHPHPHPQTMDSTHST
jgi:hypothetical protein